MKSKAKKSWYDRLCDAGQEAIKNCNVRRKQNPKWKVKIDKVVKCVEIDKAYGLEHVCAALRHGTKHPHAKFPGRQAICCYEPVPMFEDLKEKPWKSGGRPSRSIPWLGAHFEPGRKYRIRIEEI